MEGVLARLMLMSEKLWTDRGLNIEHRHPILGALLTDLTSLGESMSCHLTS